ncbi:uncharacterized protein LOC109854350 [Pseudomyrmex gracilis]|uniref:uncharacterized protein LOC109854350 n=1 Tax=Pseudomyrmex gracilis TaxID=219809 RepID=UPI00099498C8|nr:uncharacterized protein LOC109854350 [Pseudomyrmex gracilis]
MTVILFILTAFVPSILNVVFPLNTSRPLLLPIPVHYFIDEERYFYYIVCHVLIVALICINGLIAHDCMFFTYIEHVCGLFAVAGFRFEHMLYKRSEAKDSLFDRLDDTQRYCKDIALSVHVHREALQFAELIENTFSVSLAVQMMIITSTLSLTLLQLSRTEIDRSQSRNLQQDILWLVV